MYFCTMKIEISLGSNTDPEANMQRAKTLLTSILPNIRFGKEVWTKPYATQQVPHPTKAYLNCMAMADTTMEKSHLMAKLKQTEQTLGDNHHNHQQGIVLIDIDLLKYDNVTLKEKLW